MPLRLAVLPINLRLSLSHVPGPSSIPRRMIIDWNRTLKRGFKTVYRRPNLQPYQCRHLHHRPTAFPPPRSEEARKFKGVLWLIGGSSVAFLLYYRHIKSQPPITKLISSPSLIPAHPHPSQPPAIPYASTSSATANSPFEKERGVIRTVLHIVRVKIWEPVRTGLRFLRLAIIFAPVVICVPMLLVGEESDGDGDGEAERWGAVWWYDLLVKQMQRAGPTFIKLAQWAGSRRDLFPSELCNKFGTLHSTTEPHSLVHTMRVVEHVFQKRFDEVFESFDPDPIGSGAIAQVYKARLRPDVVPPDYLASSLDKRWLNFAPPILDRFIDRAVSQSILAHLPPSTSSSPVDGNSAATVAVKVLHPGVESMIQRDLQIMTFFAKAITAIPTMHWISLDEEVRAFGTMMYEQLDLRNEAGNLKKFDQNFTRRQKAEIASTSGAVSFPRPLEEYSAKQLLIEEFQEAIPLEDFLLKGARKYEQQIATFGLDAFLNMLLLDNFVHADLHPGNILVKFYKPSTAYILQSIASRIFRTAPPNDPIHSDDANEVVRRLHSLHKAPLSAWNQALDEIHQEGYQPELVFLDAGLVTTLSGENRRNFLDLFRAIAHFDGYSAGKLMIERCVSPELAIEPEIFALKMQHLVLAVKAQTFSLGRIRISDVLGEVLKNVRDHHVKMEGDFINTIISVLLLEGIGRQMDPELDLFKSALPILRKLGRQVNPKDAIAEGASGNFGAMFKFWLWMEAREFVSAATIDVDEWISYDWLSPSL